jgi:hypothetical protein
MYRERSQKKSILAHERLCIFISHTSHSIFFFYYCTNDENVLYAFFLYGAKKKNEEHCVLCVACEREEVEILFVIGE